VSNRAVFALSGLALAVLVAGGWMTAAVIRGGQ
jgi:hypothetical protein